MKPLWRFTCEADRLGGGKYRVVVVTRSGRRFERCGYHPLWELVRILGERCVERSRA